MRKQVGIAVAVLFLTTTALCQDNRFDVSLGATYAFGRQASANGINFRSTNENGIVFSARARLGSHSAFQFNYGRTKNAQEYTAAPFQYVVQSTDAEFTGAYVYNFSPIGKIEPFVMGGGGVLVFTPGATYINSALTGFGALRQNRPAVLYGGGVDYPVYKRLSVRVQYRGLVYSNPDFQVKSLFIGGKGHMAEPSAGIVFRF